VGYPLGWSLTISTEVRRERWPGNHGAVCVPLVQVGEQVQAAQSVIRLERTEANEQLVKIPRFSLPIATDGEASEMSGGEQRKKHEEIAAGLHGTVVEITIRGGVVIASQATVIAGAIGAGRQVTGPLTIWQAPEVVQGGLYVLSGMLLVVPGPLNLTFLRQAVNAGIAGVIASSISTRDFEDFLHADLIDLLNCGDAESQLATLPPLTLLLTEGLGTFAMPERTFELLYKYAGTTALLTGATSLRAKLYPDLVISLPAAERREHEQSTLPSMDLEPGALVRVCSGSHEGAIGELNYLFSRQQVFPSGIREYAARVRLADGSQLVAPLPVLLRIG
jgi:hypothetical protein